MGPRIWVGSVMFSSGSLSASSVCNTATNNFLNTEYWTMALIVARQKTRKDSTMACYTRISLAYLAAGLLLQIPNTANAWLAQSSISRGTDYLIVRPIRPTSTCLYSTEPDSKETESTESDSTEPEQPKKEKDDPQWWEFDDLEVLQGDGNDFEEDDEDWTPDREVARRKKKVASPMPASAVIKDEVLENNQEGKKRQEKERPSAYTDEEEDLIDAMGGKDKSSSSARKREAGFLGDCTLQEIAQDYSVPICYLADVLCMWGVQVPINIRDRLGDMVTGEQAFAILEAIYSLDVGSLHDRYSNDNLLTVCDYWEIDMKNAFEFAMKEGWSLPFGVQTHLRAEQEDELMRVFGAL